MKFQLTQVLTKIQQLLYITGILLCYCSGCGSGVLVTLVVEFFPIET